MDILPALTLIVARSGPLRNSLLSLMNTVPQIDKVAETKELHSLLQMEAQIQPDLLIVEANLSERDLKEDLQQIILQWSETRTVILVENFAQKQAALEAGADFVIFKGFRAARLMGVVEELLSQENSAQPSLSVGH